jgi:O-antigen/teichoic acid export membrane protein
MALAMLLFNTANLFTDIGMKSAIIQTDQDVKKASHYAFVIVMVASLIFTGLTISLAAPLASLVGGSQELVPIIRWMAIYITLDGLWIIPEALLRRELRFKELGIAQIPSELFSTVISIFLALMGMGVWSLVIGTLSGQFLRMIVLWYFCRPWFWLHRQKWDKEIVSSLLRFGVPTTGAGALRFVQDQIDTWIIGRQFGPASVGLYSKAFSLTTRLGFMLTTSIFGNVLFPSYAKIKDNIPRLTRAYLKSNKMVLLMIVPLSVGLATTAPLLVSVLLGEQWIPMIRVWQIFALYGLTRPISVNSSPLFLAVGQPRRNISASIVLLLIMVPSLLFLIEPYGIEGAAIAVSGAHLITMFFNVYQVNQILPGTARQTIKQSIPFLVSGVMMTLGLLLLQDPILNLAGGPNLLALLLQIVVSALIYVASILLLQRDLVLETYELIILSLRIDHRWPRLLPAQMRSKK